MALLPALLLAVSLAVLAWFAWRDRAEYARFKTLTATADRQRRYRAWLVTAFLLFVVGSIVVLAVLGRLGAATREPEAFLPLTASLRRALPAHLVSPELLGGLVSGMVIGAVAVVVLGARRGAKAVQLGDIGPLMPRNGAETLWTLLLSINAGVGEELCYRLVLPLLFALAFGHAAIGFALAVAAFGLAHLYQGWVGIVATGFVGALFAGLYLWSGSLAVPIALHVILDLVGLVIRPTAARLLTRH
ncbi:MAG TPA: CPBP family intramembrane glutamic endopeptidase [Caulobacteraceae bacterium]|nr:CPBP family intramembrane glutamic endopeptidase [Caulobacteraceae bacterium]